MSTGIGCGNSTSALHRPPPIADGFALRGENVPSRSCIGAMSSPIHPPVGAIAPHCDPSNPHSSLPSPNGIGACRGFLP